VGNLGENSFYKASDRYPVAVYANDFYKQGTMQCVITLYLKEKADGVLKEFTAHTRDDVVEQLPFIKKRFLTYADFGKASFDKIFTEEELKHSIKYTANYLISSFVRNNGNGNFSLEPLPAVAQFSAINAMVADDFDNDGNLDVCVNTNDFGTDPANGRYDALNGLVLKGDGKGKFKPLTIMQSGIYIPGSGKGVAKLKSGNGNYLLVASQNKGRLKVFQLKVR
ncbi:MAG TPA: VCBS repeat-containing protein, partial [Flavitalea sp.]|nr:VCBS repeat-containing protein [Flavitalea sp.]